MIDGDECDGFPTCDDCKVCDGGICTKPEDNIPCYCKGGYPCGQCEKCSREDGGCVAAPENCRKCCKTCTNGCEDGFIRCLIRCAPMDFKGFLCKYPDCPPSDEPEPCDCNCHNDCPECTICNAAGECVPDPACDDCCPEGAPPGSKCVQEQQIGVYRGGKENGYIFAVYRTNCGGWSISQTELGFWQVNFTSPCGVPVTGGGFSTDDLIDVEPLTACSEKICGSCGCDRYANGGSPAYC